MFSPFLHSWRYHLKDVIVGKIYFLLVRIKIRYMELAIVRRETTGAGNSSIKKNQFCCLYFFSIKRSQGHITSNEDPLCHQFFFIFLVQTQNFILLFSVPPINLKEFFTH